MRRRVEVGARAVKIQLDSCSSFAVGNQRATLSQPVATWFGEVPELETGAFINHHRRLARHTRQQLVRNCTKPAQSPDHTGFLLISSNANIIAMRDVAGVRSPRIFSFHIVASDSRNTRAMDHEPGHGKSLD